EVGARRARGIEEAAALPGGGEGRSQKVRDGRVEIDLAADRRSATTGGIEPRVPDEEGDGHVLLVEPGAVAPRGVRLAEALAVVAGDDDERVLGSPALAETVQDAADLTIGFAYRVEVPPEVVRVGRFRPLLEELDERLVRARLVGVVRLAGPGQDEERPVLV